nr:MAG TPA: hypothetical protein [Caudoviricetes sp.]
MTAVFFLPAPGLAPPRPPVLFDFVGTISPPLSGTFNYPFEIAFFAHVTPSRCP